MSPIEHDSPNAAGGAKKLLKKARDNGWEARTDDVDGEWKGAPHHSTLLRVAQVEGSWRGVAEWWDMKPKAARVWRRGEVLATKLSISQFATFLSDPDATMGNYTSMIGRDRLP